MEHQKSQQTLDRPPWWVTTLIGLVIGVGIFIKSLIGDFIKSNEKCKDQLFELSNKQIPVQQKSNEVLLKYLELWRQHNKNTSNEVLNSDSLHGGNTGSGKNTK